MRINKFLANCGVCSRRKADEFIEMGEVTVNGMKIKMPGLEVSEKDEIQLKGKVVKMITEKKYIAINKPVGVTSTLSDPHAKKKIIDLLPSSLAHLKTGGRLDRETEGLIIMSNDGDFLNKLMHPSFELEKEYLAEARGDLDKDVINRLEKGVKLDGKLTAPAQIKNLESLKGGTRFHIIIHEGRKRQIRLMCEAIKHPISRLRRIRIGEIELGTLANGKWRELTQAEVDSILKLQK